MYMQKSQGPHSAVMPKDVTMTRADLPDPNTRRWVASRKAAVLRAINTGVIERDEAMQLYNLSDEELDGWDSALRSHGEQGLKTTATQDLRQL